MGRISEKENPITKKAIEAFNWLPRARATEFVKHYGYINSIADLIRTKYKKSDQGEFYKILP